MGIRVKCHACGAALSAPDRLAGTGVACPKCDTDLQVPERSTVRQGASPTRPSTASNVMASLLDEWDEASPGNPPVGAKLGPANPNACPNCSAALHPQAVLCIACGYNRETGRTLKTKRDAPQSPPDRATESRRSNRTSMGNCPAFESEVSLDGLMATTGEVIYHPSHTFENLVLRGNWAPTCIYACSSYTLATLVNFAIAITFQLMLHHRQIDWRVLNDRVGIIIVGVLLLIALFVIGQLVWLWIRSAVTHALVMATGPHRGWFETTLKVNGYIDGALIWLGVIPLLGPFLLIFLYPVHSVIALRRAHDISVLRAMFIFAISLVLSIIAVCVLVSMMSSMWYSLLIAP